MVNIRRAQEKDINKIVDLLYQVHQVHANGRPDIFKAGARKYTTPELLELLQNEQKPIFVAVNAQDEVVGYAFCVYQVTANAAALALCRFVWNLTTSKTPMHPSISLRQCWL